MTPASVSKGINQLGANPVVVAPESDDDVQIAVGVVRAASDAPEDRCETDVWLFAQRLEQPTEERPVAADVGALARWNDDFPRPSAAAAKQASLGGPTQGTPVHADLLRQNVQLSHVSKLPERCVQ